MTWGWASGFVIEYARSSKGGKSCRNCKNFVRTDKSCKLTAIYPPEDGYDSWKRCGLYNKLTKAGANTTQPVKKNTKKDSKKKHKTNEKKPVRIINKENCSGLHLNFCTNFQSTPKDREMVLLEIELENERKKSKITSCAVGNEIYVLTNNLDPEKLKAVIQMFDD